MQILSPFRVLRLTFRGYLRRKESGQLKFAKLRFFWQPLSNVCDLKRDYDDVYLARQLARQGISIPVKLEDRFEQFGQLRGTVEFDEEPLREVYLWGQKCKKYPNGNSGRRIIRLFGYDKRGFAFHIGFVRENNGAK